MLLNFIIENLGTFDTSFATKCSSIVLNIQVVPLESVDCSSKKKRGLKKLFACISMVLLVFSSDVATTRIRHTREPYFVVPLLASRHWGNSSLDKLGHLSLHFSPFTSSSLGKNQVSQVPPWEK